MPILLCRVLCAQRRTGAPPNWSRPHPGKRTDSCCKACFSTAWKRAAATSGARTLSSSRTKHISPPVALSASRMRVRAASWLIVQPRSDHGSAQPFATPVPPQHKCCPWEPSGWVQHIRYLFFPRCRWREFCFAKALPSTAAENRKSDKPNFSRDATAALFRSGRLAKLMQIVGIAAVSIAR